MKKFYVLLISTLATFGSMPTAALANANRDSFGTTQTSCQNNSSENVGSPRLTAGQFVDEKNGRIKFGAVLLTYAVRPVYRWVGT